MSKLLPIEREGEIIGYLFDCPGCGMSHSPFVRPYKNSVGATWTFNNDMELPTFSPSIRVRYEKPNGEMMVCHSFVVDGKIQFLSDCTHTLVNQIVDLPNQD